MMIDLSKISYDPLTGIFRWAISGRGIALGKVAGSKTSDGYWQIKINRSVYSGHRLAWFITFGDWPNGEIDHIDGNPLNNRIKNLRVVSRSGNSQNRRKAQKGSASGLLGVAWHCRHKRWMSKIQANKVSIFIGYFDDKYAAHEAYMKVKEKLHIAGG